ncbi:hypothetical protein [Nonlabens marinus]|uniref:Uncharacterized protein n=1 Tax=Nonlabens marinus S1-08 TaxID=1454201 RepID=W8VST9_9FLAO|nr:hypothetical protein [Nonlabens marinus]BAO56500.1 hypothetical protein NMS_2491 [Nonlabens marinus S1-08]
MSSLFKNLDDCKILLFNIDARLRNQHRQFISSARLALEQWIDKKTSPYGDSKAVKR